MNRCYCLTWDFNDDPALIAEYKRYHEKIWPEITKSIKDEGIRDLEIYLRGTRIRPTFWAARAPKVLSFLACKLLAIKSKTALFVELVVTPR
jgi:L-rhamnose mutarotase-like protein